MVGTDSHTTMINGLGIVGWGRSSLLFIVYLSVFNVPLRFNCIHYTYTLPFPFLVPFLSGVGGIEAEAVMLDQSISMVLPKVVGYKLIGEIDPMATSTDVVLTITKVGNLYYYDKC